MNILDNDSYAVPLTKGYYAIIDIDDKELVMQYRWRVVTRRHTAYAIRSWRDERTGIVKSELMHTFLLGIRTGIDHIDGDGLNNRRSNLRPADQHQNNGNYKKRKGASQYKGVCRSSGSAWKAQIRKGDKKHYLGSFANEEDAAKAYDEAAKEYFGEYAQLNFPVS